MKNANKGGWWSTSSWFPSLYSSFSTKIVENLQLDIANVHFRYECKEESRQFAFGVQIGNLSAQSTNENWVNHSNEYSSFFFSNIKNTSFSTKLFIFFLFFFLFSYSSFHFEI